MKTYEKLQLLAEEMKHRHLNRNSMPGKRKKDSGEERMVPFFCKESGAVYVTVDFLKLLGEKRDYFLTMKSVSLLKGDVPGHRRLSTSTSMLILRHFI